MELKTTNYRTYRHKKGAFLAENTHNICFFDYYVLYS